MALHRISSANRSWHCAARTLMVHRLWYIARSAAALRIRSAGGRKQPFHRGLHAVARLMQRLHHLQACQHRMHSASHICATTAQPLCLVPLMPLARTTHACTHAVFCLSRQRTCGSTSGPAAPARPAHARCTRAHWHACTRTLRGLKPMPVSCFTASGSTSSLPSSLA